MMDFGRLILKHSEMITAEISEDGYRDFEDGGTWKEGTTITKEIRAAVFQMGIKGQQSTNIKYGEGGQYSVSDIKVYINERLPLNSKIIWRGSQYTVSEELDYSTHSNNLFIYLCKKGVG